MSELEKFKLHYEDVNHKFDHSEKPFVIFRKLIADVYSLLERLFNA